MKPRARLDELVGLDENRICPSNSATAPGGKGLSRTRHAARDERPGPAERVDRPLRQGGGLTVRPYMPDNSGDVLRWVLEIDGAELSDMDIRTGPHPERPDVMIMLLVRGRRGSSSPAGRAGAGYRPPTR
jgi:hypothetical protein